MLVTISRTDRRAHMEEDRLLPALGAPGRCREMCPNCRVVECARTQPVVSQPVDMGRVSRALITTSNYWVWPASKATTVRGKAVEETNAERVVLRESAVCGSYVGVVVGGMGKCRSNGHIAAVVGNCLHKVNLSSGRGPMHVIHANVRGAIVA